jgi:hypothetical protein
MDLYQADLDHVVRAVILAADTAVLERSAETRASQTRAAVSAAIRCAVENGFLAMNPRSEWPEYVSLTPPYRRTDDRP